MIKKYGPFRKIQASKPQRLTGLEWQRVIAALQHGGNKSPSPPGNIWDDSEIWRDSNTWND